MRAFLLALWGCVIPGIGCAAESPTDASSVLAAYDAIRVPLVADQMPAAADAARALAAAAPTPDLAAASLHVANAADLTAMRLAYADLSRKLVLAFAASPPKDLRVYRCPMAPAYPYWLQDEAGLQNPYMGTSMPGCGEGTTLKEAVKAAQQSTTP
jgi:hypothetical protein